VRRYGSVSVAVQVLKDGSVGRMVVTESMNAEIDRDVLKAVQQWRFLPFTCDGVPVNSETEVVIDFGAEQTTTGFSYPLKF
jgi:TonB family protein